MKKEAPLPASLGSAPSIPAAINPPLLPMGLLGGANVGPVHPALQNPIIAAFARNQGFIKPGQNVYNTQLSPQEEQAFRIWMAQNNVPFDPNAQVADYDMRGFYRALQAGDPRTQTAVNANDGQLHYPDYWKTPFHASFSNESQWANESAPAWNDKDQLVAPGGAVIYDERAIARAKQ